MKALPPTTRLSHRTRQLSMPLDAQSLSGLSPSERRIVIVRLASLLMAAAGIVQETGNDAQ